MNDGCPAVEAVTSRVVTAGAVTFWAGTVTFRAATVGAVTFRVVTVVITVMLSPWCVWSRQRFLSLPDGYQK